MRTIAQLAQERDGLTAQRDALERERDELAGHCRRLTAERQQLITAVSTIGHERDSLSEHVRTDANKPAPPLLWQHPGHFYSPVVDATDPAVVRAAAERDASGADVDPACFGIDEQRMLAFVEHIGRNYAELPFPEQRVAGCRYYYENSAYSYGDAMMLFLILREFAPKRLIEVGSGYSSAVTMETNDRFFNGSIRTSFIDPYPETVLSRLSANDRYRDCIIPSRLQDVPLSLFQELGENDVLFIDSSHVVKTASDVNDYAFRILPALAPGVVIHIHDVLYPFEYASDWVVDENRSWNEAYLLRALLSHNPAYEILTWNNLLLLRHFEWMRERFPLFVKNSGSSMWLRKVR